MTKPLSTLIDISHYRSILCLNGDLPPRDFFTGELPIIAADGAANKLIQMDIKPSIIIGDLDSVHDHIKSSHQLLHDPDQDRCDYQKSLAYLENHHLLPTIVTGIHGGMLDHVLNNINLFLQSDNLFYSPPTFGFCIQAGKIKLLRLERNTKISLIGAPNATITSQGLKWELHQTMLSFPGNNSCFNRTVSEQISISVESGVALIIIYAGVVNDAGNENA